MNKIDSIQTKEDVEELFEYRDGDLYWKINVSKKVKQGYKAGSVGYQGNYKTPYRRIYYKGRFYLSSRLIFLMFYGYLPECVICKDKNDLNTRIENLLEASRSEVYYRKRVASHSKTGVKGVFLNKREKKYGAQITKNKKVVHLGYYDTAEEASKAYEEAKNKYHGSFLDKCVS